MTLKHPAWRTCFNTRHKQGQQTPYISSCQNEAEESSFSSATRNIPEHISCSFICSSCFPQGEFLRMESVRQKVFVSCRLLIPSAKLLSDKAVCPGLFLRFLPLSSLIRTEESWDESATRPDKQASLSLLLFSAAKKGTPLDPAQNLEFRSNGPGTFVPSSPWLRSHLPLLSPPSCLGGASCQGAKASQPSLCAQSRVETKRGLCAGSQ